MSQKTFESDNSVLVVEDDVNTREILAKIVENRASHVFQAEDGQEALDFLRRRPVDLLITDIAMPRLDGISLVETVARENLAQLCILVTCVGSREEIKRALVCGVHDFIDKPFTADVVANRVGKALDSINIRNIENEAVELLFQYFGKAPSSLRHLSNEEKIRTLKDLLVLFRGRLRE